MRSIQEICARTGRELGACEPTAVAGQEVEWADSAPWERFESPDPTAVIFVAPAARGLSWVPNVVGTCVRIVPGMDRDEALYAIAATAADLQDWNGTEDIAGEGEAADGRPGSSYRFVAGTYTAEPGEMATSSLLVGWNDPEATYVFQFICTTFATEVATHEQAFDCVRIGGWTAGEIVAAMRG